MNALPLNDLASPEVEAEGSVRVFAVACRGIGISHYAQSFARCWIRTGVELGAVGKGSVVVTRDHVALVRPSVASDRQGDLNLEVVRFLGEDRGVEANEGQHASETGGTHHHCPATEYRC